MHSPTSEMWKVRAFLAKNEITLGYYVAGGVPVLSYEGDYRNGCRSATLQHEKVHEGLCWNSSYGAFCRALGELEERCKISQPPEGDAEAIRRLIRKLIAASYLTEEGCATAVELMTVAVLSGERVFRERLDSLWYPYSLALSFVNPLVEGLFRWVPGNRASGNLWWMGTMGLCISCLQVNIFEEFFDYHSLRLGKPEEFRRFLAVPEHNPDKRLYMLAEAALDPEYNFGLLGDRLISETEHLWDQAFAEKREDLLLWRKAFDELSEKVFHVCCSFVSELGLFPVDLQIYEHGLSLAQSIAELENSVLHAWGEETDSFKFQLQERVDLGLLREIHTFHFDKEALSAEIIQDSSSMREWIDLAFHQTLPRGASGCGVISCQPQIAVGIDGMCCEPFDGLQVSLMCLYEDEDLDASVLKSLCKGVAVSVHNEQQARQVIEAFGDHTVCVVGLWDLWKRLSKEKRMSLLRSISKPVYLCPSVLNEEAIYKFLSWGKDNATCAVYNDLGFVDRAYCLANLCQGHKVHLLFFSAAISESNILSVLKERGVEAECAKLDYSRIESVTLGMALWECRFGPTANIMANVIARGSHSSISHPSELTFKRRDIEPER